jgi:hypothetical protein
MMSGDLSWPETVGPCLRFRPFWALQLMAANPKLRKEEDESAAGF